MASRKHRNGRNGSNGKKHAADGFDVRALRARFPVLSRRVDGHPLVYLDSAATSQRPREVLEAMDEYYRHDNANSHQRVHPLGKRSKELDDEARQTVADYIGATTKDEVVWVKGATEGINVVARTWAEENVKRGDNVVLTVTEHYSNLIPWQQLAKRTGCDLRFVDVDADGRLRVDQLEKFITRRTRLVSLSHVSNALGMINPVHVAVELAKPVRARVLVDGAQSAPHLAIDVEALGCDFFCFSAHKMGGPFGTGVLWTKEELLEEMTPSQFGGGTAEKVTLRRHRFMSHPESFEAGTGNPAASVGFRAAIELVQEMGQDEMWHYEQALVSYGLERLGAVDGLTLLGSREPWERVPLFTFSYKDRDGEEVARSLARQGIAVSGGKLHAQPLLKRFGLESAVRVSCWAYTTTHEIDRVAEALESRSSWTARAVDRAADVIESVR